MNTPSLLDTSVPKEKRNDNSNPQQGTGDAKVSQEPLSKTSAVNSSAPVRYSRPSLKIPPTAKDERKLFVGGLPPNVTSEEFRLFFEQFGPVMDSIVLVDKFTNRSRGFGFVTFEHVSTAKKLLSMGHPEGAYKENPTSGRLEMQGKIIEVKSAEPKESTRRVQYDTANQPIPSAYAVPVPADSALFSPYYYGHPGHAPAGAVFAGYVAPMYYMPANMEYPYQSEGFQMIYHPQPVMMDGYMAQMPPPQPVALMPGVENPAMLPNAAIHGQTEKSE